MHAAHSKMPTLRTSSNGMTTHSAPSTLLRSTTAKSLTPSAMPGAHPKMPVRRWRHRSKLREWHRRRVFLLRGLPYQRLAYSRPNGHFARQGSQCLTTTTASERALQSRSFAAEQANSCVSWKGPRCAGLATAGLKYPSPRT
jgi:hypothetical protein